MNIFGIPNVGNTCFINSLYQALYYSAYKLNIEELLDYRKDVASLLDLTNMNLGSQDCSFDAFIQITDKLKIDEYFNMSHLVKIQCTKCNNMVKKKVTEKFFVPTNSFNDLFKNTEVMSGYICDKCKGEDHIKLSQLCKVSNVLCFYMYKYKGSNIPKRIIVENDKYTLSGYVIHYGNIEGGHYVACGLRDDNWYTFNDNNVNPGELEDRKYILFYTIN